VVGLALSNQVIEPESRKNDRPLGDITAVILAGGLGTRLRNVVTDRPKPLAEINGKPFVVYLLDQLADAGLRQVILCTGYRAEQVVRTLGMNYRQLSLYYSQEKQPLGTAGALRLALPLLTSDIILVMNGDSFCECDLVAFWEWHTVRQATLSLLLTRVSDVSRYGQVEQDADSVIVRFAEKQSVAAGQSGWVNAGVYLMSRSAIAQFAPDQAISLERDIFPSWIGHGLCGYRGGRRFIDIGLPETLQLAHQFFDPGVL